MSRRSYQKSTRRGKQHKRTRGRRPDVAVQLSLCHEELMAMMQDSLESFATEMGLRIAAKLLEEEVFRRCGPRYEHRVLRELTRHGRQRGVVTLAGQKLPIQRRARAADRRPRRSRVGDLRSAASAMRRCPRHACEGWSGAFRPAITKA